jgi:predicted LPLAT superfamily acyltransferase
MAESWTEQRERSNPFALRILAFTARRLGRRVARFGLIWPVALYFLLTAARARRASRDYLSRILGRPARLRHIWWHFATFGTVSIDRIYVHTGDRKRLDIRCHNIERFTNAFNRGRGALVLASHFGSFDLLHSLVDYNPDARLRILMDRATGAKANAVLSAISAGPTPLIIDTSDSDIDRALRVQNALTAGELVGLMGDRVASGERSVTCDFLGGRAPFPASPWLLAGLTGAPVLLAFSVYRGGNRYDVYCEEFGERLDLPRGQRMLAAGDYAQQYADRLASYVRAAPYNWFNFYRFWH